MRDPFRPNTDSQLVREAQFAFVVIVVLLCVLVYVAFHRVSGRRFHFRQIAQAAPLALHVDDTSYPAQNLLDRESRFNQEPNSNSIGNPTPNPTEQTNSTSSANNIRTLSQRIKPSTRTPKQISNSKKISKSKFRTPPVDAIESPSDEKVVVASAADLPAKSIAHAQFITPMKSAVAFQPIRRVKPSVDTAVVDDPFEKIKSDNSSFKLAQPIPEVANDKEKGQPSSISQPAISKDKTGGFSLPKIKSDFGAGSTRELPSFDAPTKKKETVEEVKTPIPSQLQTALPEPQDNAFSIKQKTVSKAEKPATATKEPVTKEPVAMVAEKKIRISQLQEPLKQRSFNSGEYRIKKSDSLWSIAVDHYGDGRFFRALYQHNLKSISSADQLEPNALIAVPKINELLKRYPDLCPADKLGDNISDAGRPETDYLVYEQKMDARFHVTNAGDTLFDIARQRLGQASRYLEIFELNRFRIPQHVDHLTPLDPGLRLLLPE